MNIDNELNRLDALAADLAKEADETAAVIKTVINERDELRHDLNNALQNIIILEMQVKALMAQRDDLAKCLKETTAMLDRRLR